MQSVVIVDVLRTPLGGRMGASLPSHGFPFTRGMGKRYGAPHHGGQLR